ncbi:hypothetical protein B0H16DRAFT_1456753 [Mycena metata]|uniref:Uncharacterized protein n=1 Tax=Mycena metata TaxID=1033252 RepID=A0AAD7NGI7_9AGAR|nr:hypothetical protein B0H16DRAFT_1456753 [Mycena metata]
MSVHRVNGAYGVGRASKLWSSSVGLLAVLQNVVVEQVLEWQFKTACRFRFLGSSIGNGRENRTVILKGILLYTNPPSSYFMALTEFRLNARFWREDIAKVHATNVLFEQTTTATELHSFSVHQRQSAFMSSRGTGSDSYLRNSKSQRQPAMTSQYGNPVMTVWVTTG